VGEYTPGRWEVVPHIFDPDGWWVAGPSWFYAENNEVGLANEADARLIAAAPELLAALELIVLVEDRGSIHLPLEFDKARAAIAKAKGSEVVAP
jgi:hypothetical protein